MADPVPAIHAETSFYVQVYGAVARRATRRRSETALVRHNVDTRDKPGHDADTVDQTNHLSANALSRG
jgi:hypothetical protein